MSDHHISLSRSLRLRGDLITVSCCCGFAETMPSAQRAFFAPFIAQGYPLAEAIEQAVTVAMQAEADVWGAIVGRHLMENANLQEVVAAWAAET